MLVLLSMHRKMLPDWGWDLDTLLLMPHIADFAVADHREQVEAYFNKVIAGQGIDEEIEFPSHHASLQANVRKQANAVWFMTSIGMCFNSP